MISINFNNEKVYDHYNNIIKFEDDPVEYYIRMCLLINSYTEEQILNDINKSNFKYNSFSDLANDGIHKIILINNQIDYKRKINI